MEDREDNGDFLRDRRLILYRLDHLDTDIGKIRDAVDRIEVDLMAMKVRAGMWGAIAGGLPSLMAAIAFYLWKGHGP